MKERKESRDRVNVRHGNLGPHGQIFHLVGWEVAELFLYRSEVVEYQTVIICIFGPPKCKGGSGDPCGRGLCWVLRFEYVISQYAV